MMHAFPSVLADDARKAVAALPETRFSSTPFTVSVGGEVVSIPDRIYHNPIEIDRVPLNHLQNELVDCLLTRHNDGYIREEFLRRIIARNETWAAPFVLHLVGEPVVEILRVIWDNIANLDPSIYRSFMNENRKFTDLIEQRVISYWDCYYRTKRREDYVGFNIVNYLRRLE